MKHVIEAWTEAASLVLFDPHAFPVDYKHGNDDAGNVIDRLHTAGTVFWVNSEGDGAFLLHAYVDEPLPGDLRPFLRDPEESPAFPVPGGRLYITGIEYASRQSEAFVRTNPHMGGSVAVAPGVYLLTFYRAEFPDGSDDEFRRRASSAGVWRCAAVDRLTAATVFTVLAAVAGLCVVGWRTWAATAGAALAAELVLLVVLRRSPVFRAADAIRKQIGREFPDFVATLERKIG